MKNRFIINIWFVLVILVSSLGFVNKTEIFDPEKLYNPGKIWLLRDRLLVNERYKGIHIYDISCLDNPVHESFIPIEGNFDMAVKDNYLYADHRTDLVVYDISDTSYPRMVYALENIFHYRDFADGFREGCSGMMCGCDSSSDSQSSNQNSPSTGNNNSGQGGSMARFTISGDYLYCIDGSSLVTVNIREPEKPEESSSDTVGWGIETIFPYNNNLFLGSRRGMYIYSLENPEMPEYVSSLLHVRACDPVVIYGNYAYVTLRAGRACGGLSSQLDIIDISDLANPTLVKTYGLSGPYGLAADDTYVYICDGTSGLRIIDKQNLDDMYQVNSINDIGLTYDVILSRRKILHITTSEGLYFYDANDITQLNFEGVILKETEL